MLIFQGLKLNYQLALHYAHMHSNINKYKKILIPTVHFTG